ncbi:SGNH/GDSL hydrolase family protein [Actinoplanes sp. N902-109]|uniref:SGNH/GDSL hydrolase family protein n=1 Tax=Actinoplanes sp. (strain N902-109) TaxID=649831 RepID=UPI0003293604|nr:SGNH/GDSL hydrolase family protein [Actinoplanes sp. N902-109]AGL13874.1 YapH protein [Actinoplanes sp. N902-109]
MATYSQAGTYSGTPSGAPVGVSLRVVDATGSDAVLYTDIYKRKTVGPIVRANPAGVVTFFADPGTYTVQWTGGSTTVAVTGGVVDTSAPSSSGSGSSTTATVVSTALAPICGAYHSATEVSDGVVTGVNTMVRFQLPPTQFGALRLRFTNSRAASTSESDGPFPVTIKASVGYTANGTWVPVRLNGSSTFTIEGGADVQTDPVSIFPTAGMQYLYVKTFASVTAGQTWYPQSPEGVKGTDWWCSQSNGETDLTLSTATFNATSGNMPFAPSAVVDEYSPRTRPSVALVGDSIMAGINDTNLGFGIRALRGVMPYQRTAVSGSTVFHFTNPLNSRRRLNMMRGCNLFIEEYGTNDLVALSRTAAQIQADRLYIWQVLVARGMRGGYATTLIPRTTSTDSWATTANQTPLTSGSNPEANRVAINDWIRDGAPLDPITRAVAATGTSGALRAGATGHPLLGYFEVADTVETARNSGLWKVNGTANYLTNDGIHPTAAGNILMAPAIVTATLTAAAAA